MSKNPLISVIIPVFNSQRYLKENLESVINQDFKNIEILVIDGNSTDCTEDICKSFSEIDFYRQEGKGISDALNYGIEESKGEFISFISSDDLWMPNKLSTQVKFMMENPDIEYTVTKAKFFLDAGSKKPSNFRAEFLNKETVQSILETLMARKSLFDKIGLFDRSFSTGMDTEWFTRAIDNNINSAIINEVLTHKRVHNGSTVQNTENIMGQTIRALHKSIKRKKLNANERD